MDIVINKSPLYTPKKRKGNVYLCSSEVPLCIFVLLSVFSLNVFHPEAECPCLVSSDCSSKQIQKQILLH